MRLGGEQLIDGDAKLLHQGQVLSLAAAADIVGFARHSAREYRLDAAAMILDVQPITYVAPVAVNRQLFRVQDIDDHQRDELLRELPWTVVVRAVADRRRQSVGAVIGANEVIRGCLARGIRGIRRVR